jgi:hypothetical protein
MRFARRPRVRRLPRRDLVYNTPLPPVHFWTEVSTPEEIRQPRRRKPFSEAFGLANREQFDVRTADPSSSHDADEQRLRHAPRACGGGTPRATADRVAEDSGEIVDELFLATLSRYPTLQERRTAVSWLDADRAKRSDLQWVLLNKVDFVFNY